VAKSQGQTQLHASYRGKEVLAKVSVSGKRFETVNPSLNELSNDQFDVTIEVLAAGAEGELEYRYMMPRQPTRKRIGFPISRGQQSQGDAPQRRDDFGPRGMMYHLVFGGPRQGTKRVEKYPLSLQLGVTLKKVEDSPQAPVKDSTPGKDTK